MERSALAGPSSHSGCNAPPSLGALVSVLDLDKTFVIQNHAYCQYKRLLQPVALDPLARRSMKTVAKCDKWCDMQVQNLYVNHRIVERTASSLTQERYAPLSVIMSSRLVVLFAERPVRVRDSRPLGRASSDVLAAPAASGDLVMNVEVCQQAPCARSFAQPLDQNAVKRNFST